jgi:trigger factor
VVYVDVTGTPDEGETVHRERMPIEVGAEANLDAFNAQLTGVRAGDELEFPVDYPEDYGAKEMAGKRVSYRMKVHEVKQPVLPNLDDEFAKDLGEFDDLAALRAKVRADLEVQKKQKAEAAARQAVMDKVLLANPVVLPEVLVEHEIRRRLEDFVRSLMMQGIDPEKQEINWEELRKQQEEPARKAVHARLVLDEVARVEKIEVDAEAIETRIREDAKRLGEPVEKLRARLRKHDGEEALVTQMVREKTLDYLTSVANIQYAG